MHRLVEGASVARASLHNALPLWRHLHVAPFLALWAGLVAAWAAAGDGAAAYEDLWLLATLLLGIAHALAWLGGFWSVDFRTAATCLAAAEPHAAQLIKVVPAEHRGAVELCTIHRDADAKDAGGRPQLWFTFQRRKYVLDPDKKVFRRLQYPTQLDMGFYQSTVGYPSQAHVDASLKKYGPNSFDIPLPTFVELYKEHAVAPFFVFQVFCVALWCLDEYWYFSLFTLFMLLTFESTVVFQRLRSVSELRKMAPKPYPILVHRGAWITVTTDALLPGDVCSLVRSQNDRAVPADVLLLGGTCIVNEAMLTGESTPQIKEPIGERPVTETLDIINRDKAHVVFGGTKVIQSTAVAPDAAASGRNLVAPDGGALGFVLRTGYATSQGKLVRTILFSTERVTANNLESLFFILFLMVFAVAASAYVWVKGMNSGRTRWKVVLDCVLIITSVIPPELPMELALAVNQSIIALTQRAIFCTEPFRIPFAGKVEICCFDKTGTLTTEELLVEGLAGLKGATLLKGADVPETSAMVIGVCHALMQTDQGLIGDPMEKAALEAVDWTFGKNNVASPLKGARSKHLRLVRRFPFSSALKRMATVSTFEGGGDERVFVAVKGAPETIATMLTDAPADYQRLHKQFAIQGARVLALGYKHLPAMSMKAIKELERDAVESELHFAGFLVLSCPLKKDASQALMMLTQSSHRVLMITGDNALTACHVAREVHIVKRPVLIMDARPGVAHVHKLEDLQWSTIDESQQRPVEHDPQRLLQTFWDNDVCMTGQALSVLSSQAGHLKLQLGQALAHVRVFARTSPQEKELILTSLKQAGYITLMCGDGTNDVGALKQAHVGVALLDGKPEDLPKILQQMRSANLERRKKAHEEAKRRQNELLLQRQAQNRGRAAAGVGAVRPPESITEATQRQRELYEMTQKLMVEMEENEVPLVKLGDASIAAPFTSKISHVTSICDIIRQGRSTLVTTVQMYKILALNCLITAYSLSVLFFDGIKYGDTQMTIHGILLAVCFLGLSNAKPVNELSKKRPQPNIFNLYILLSVVGQFAVHIFSLIAVTSMAKSFMEPIEKIDLEKHFEPSLLNGAVYLISLSMQVSTFVVNYQGRPFRESLFENKPLFYSLSIVMTICLVAASDVSGDVRTWLGMVPFPEEFRNQLLVWIGIDFFGALAIEQVAAFLFSDNRPHPSLRL